MPHRMLNLRYETKGDDPQKIEGPFVIASSHDFETADIMLMCNEIRNFKKRTNIVAGKGNRLSVNQFFKDFPLFTHYNKIDVDGDKTGIGKMLTDKLKGGENVLLFLKKETSKKGVYHLLKDSKVPIVFVKIYKKNGQKPDDMRNYPHYLFGEEFIIEYKLEKEYPIEKEPQEFLEYVKERLYTT